MITSVFYRFFYLITLASFTLFQNSQVRCKEKCRAQNKYPFRYHSFFSNETWPSFTIIVAVFCIRHSNLNIAHTNTTMHCKLPPLEYNLEKIKLNNSLDFEEDLERDITLVFVKNVC